MFRTLYGGAPEAAFHLELEYSQPLASAAHPTGLVPSSSPSAALAPVTVQTSSPTHPSSGKHGRSPAVSRRPAPRLELDWSHADTDEAAVVARLQRGCAALIAAHAAPVVRVQLALDAPPDATAATAGGVVIRASKFGGAAPRVRLQLSYSIAEPVLRGLTFTRTSGTGTASEALVTALLRTVDTSTVRKLKLCDGLGWAVAAWAVAPRAWGALRGLSLNGCGLSGLPPVVGDLAQLKVGWWLVVGLVVLLWGEEGNAGAWMCWLSPTNPTNPTHPPTNCNTGAAAEQQQAQLTPT